MKLLYLRRETSTSTLQQEIYYMLKVWKYVEKEHAVSAKAIAMDNEQDNIDFWGRRWQLHKLQKLKRQ